MWELAPGNDFTPEQGVGTPFVTAANAPGYRLTTGSPATIIGINPVEAYIVGRSFVDPNDVTKGFEGPAMDVAAYSTFIYCKQ